MDQFTQVPPHDESAERAVIGSLLLDFQFAWPLVEAVGLKSSDFYRTFNAEVFRRLALWAWANRQPDILTIRDSVATGTNTHPDETADLLAAMCAYVPSAANADFYAGIVKDKSLRRDLIQAAVLTYQKAYAEDHDSSITQEIQFALDDLERLQDAGVGPERLLAYDGNELLADPPAKRDLLVGEGILGLGEWILLLGEPKAGKSALALDLAAELVRDEEAEATWAGFSVFGPRRVLFLVGEGGKRSMYKRWEKRSLGLGQHERARLLTWFPDPHLMDIMKPEQYSRLQRFIEDNAIEVVILDPLAHFHAGDENDAGDMKRVAGQFIRLQATTGVACVVVHHTRKAQANSRRGSPLEGRGSTAIFGASDGAIMFEFEGKQDDSERRMTFSLRHAEEFVDSKIVTLNRSLLRFEVQYRNQGGRPQDDETSRDDFVDWVEVYGKPLTLKNASEETGLPLRTVQRWAKELIKIGQFKRARSGNRKYTYGLAIWYEDTGEQKTFEDAGNSSRQTSEGGLAPRNSTDTSHGAIDD